VSTATLAGADVLTARIDLPPRRRWCVEARISTATAPTGAAVLETGGLQLTGTIVRSVSFLGTSDVWLVGGAGGIDRSAALAYQSAQLRHPLEALARAGGESLDASISSALLALPLTSWDVAGRIGAALEALADEAARQQGAKVGWRILASGKLWMGSETWPAETLPDHAQIVDRLPGLQVAIIGCEAPTLLPGVDLDGFGKVGHVTHRIGPDGVRTEAALWS